MMTPLIPGTHLCTKDGRKQGNAIVIAVAGEPDRPLYTVMSDFGNTVTGLTTDKLLGLFWIGGYSELPEWMAARDRVPEPVLEPITVRYLNWKGACRARQILPGRLYFGKTPFHRNMQWLISAYDPEDNQLKDFALEGCDFLSVNHPSHQEDALS